MWQISKELYEHLQHHASMLVRGAAELEARGEDTTKVSNLEEELSFLLCKLEDGGHVKGG